MEGKNLTVYRGDYIFIEGIRKAPVRRKEMYCSPNTGSDGNVRGITLALEGLTETERDILLAGCLINYYRKQENRGVLRNGRI